MENWLLNMTGKYYKKAGTQTARKDYPRPGFLMGAAIKCYAVKRCF